MADGGFPNRNRADNALTIYRDAMREYIAPILEREHGPDWIRSQVLNDELRERNRRSYERQLQSLKGGTPARDFIDLAEIPFLIRNNLNAFPDLSEVDVQRLQEIRRLRNEIAHDQAGDMSEAAASVANLCALALERCGQTEAAERVRRMLPTATDAESEDIDALRRWFEADPDRRKRHPDAFAELVHAEDERAARAGLEADLAAQRAWFEADTGRRQRHPSAYEALAQRELERRG